MPHTYYSENFLELKEVTLTFIENTSAEKELGSNESDKIRSALAAVK